jgi:hypothetical protein
MSRPSRKRGAPKGAGPGRAEHDQGGSGFAYDADGLEVLGLGPGLIVLMGLPPLTPSAMAFRMSTSTTNFEPTIFTTTPFMGGLPSRGVLASTFLEGKKSGQTHLSRFARDVRAS